MTTPVLTLNGVSTSANGIDILKDINFSLYPGEIHLVVGENGAGKSSLAKVISGLLPDYTGNIQFAGKSICISSPAIARDLKIISLHQECNVFENLTVAQNIFVNHPDFFDHLHPKFSISQMNKRAKEILGLLSFPLNATDKVKQLDLAQKRMVEIARVSILKPEILILDEPTVSLNAEEIQPLYQAISHFKKNNTAIMIITHEVKNFVFDADRITIMRDGRVIASETISNDFMLEISQKVWGKYYPNKYPKLKIKLGKEILCIESLCTNELLKNISFSLNEGEILGISGLVGSGRSQIAKSIIGLHPISSGTIYIDRLKATINSPRNAIDYGIAYVTQNRYEDGLFMNLNVLSNVIAIEKSIKAPFFVDKKRSRKIYEKLSQKINLSADPDELSMFELSGGTQQKVLLQRWLLSPSKIFILDEPTQGIDIASKVDIYNLINDLARKKAGIIMISASFEELQGMCDRILILNNGEITFEAKRDVPGDFDKLYEYALSSK